MRRSMAHCFFHTTRSECDIDYSNTSMAALKVSRGKRWHLDTIDGQIFVFKDGKKLCHEGGTASRKEYGGVTKADTFEKNGVFLIKVRGNQITSSFSRSTPTATYL